MTSNRCQKATKMILKHHANLSISYPYVWISPRIIIPSLSLRKLTKIDDWHMCSADLALLDGYNCTEMWRRRRTNGRLSTFDDVKHRFSDIIEQWRGGVIEFAHATVSKCSHPPKNQQSESVAQPVLNTEMTFLLEKICLKLLHNFWYFPPMLLHGRLICFFCGLDVSKRIILWRLCKFAINFLWWNMRPNQMMCNSCWSWTERRWYPFNPAKIYTKEWKCVRWLLSLCWHPIAFLHNDE